MRLVACAVVAVLDASAIVGAGPTPSIDAEVRAAVVHGRARVVVELRMQPPIRPEGSFADAGERLRQREAIAAAQDDAIAALAGTDFVVVRRFATQPLLALEIGPSALAALETMGTLVTRVVVDAPARPAPKL